MLFFASLSFRYYSFASAHAEYSHDFVMLVVLIAFHSTIVELIHCFNNDSTLVLSMKNKSPSSYNQYCASSDSK